MKSYLFTHAEPLVDDVAMGGAMPRIQHANAEEFIHIFVNNGAQLTEFLEHMVEVQPNSSSLVYNTLLELYLQDMVHQQSISVSGYIFLTLFLIIQGSWRIKETGIISPPFIWFYLFMAEYSIQN